MKTHLSRAAACGLTFAVLCSSGASAATDLSGFWKLKTDPTTVTPAKATPAGSKLLTEIKSGSGLDVVKGSVEYAALWCTQYGIAGQMVPDLPLDIRQSPIETVVLSGVRGEPHHIYTDGQKHPDTADFDFSSVGHSVGHWEKDIFVADTMGISGLGVRIIPGGGVVTEKTHLVERYALTGPDTLRITFTWTDATTLRGAHTYSLDYDRVKGVYWAPDPPCNPIRAMRAKGLPLPADAPQS